MILTPDEVLEHVGSFGRYQVRLIGILGVFVLVTSFQPFLLVFIAIDPPWKCVDNSLHCNLTGSFSFGDEKFTYRCNIPRNSWEFDTQYTSIVTKWELVCDDAPLAGLATSLLAVGGIFGRILIGILADSAGRKIAIFSCLLSFSVIHILSAFSTFYWFYALCRFFIGFFAEAIYSPIFVIATEFSGVRYRGISGSLIWTLFGLGLIVLSLLAWLITDWVVLSIVTGVPGILACSLWWWTPESVRWLLVKNRDKSARETFKYISRTNRKEMPNVQLQVPKNSAQGQGKLLDLFRTRRDAMINIVQWIIWFACAMVFGGVVLNVSSLGGNIYLNFALQGGAEIIGNGLAAAVINKIGRKKGIIGGLAISAVASVLVAIIPPGDDPGYVAARTIFAVLSKLMVTAAWCAVAIYTAEITPTVIRNIALGACATTISFAYFVAAYLFLLSSIHPVIPFSILAVVALFAGLLALLLPETNMQPTPEFLSQKCEMKNERDEIKENMLARVCDQVTSV